MLEGSAVATISVEPARFTLHAGRVLYDDGVRVRMSPGLASVMAEARAYVHPRDGGALAASEGQTVEVTNDRGSVELPLAFDSSLAPGTVYVPANLPETGVLGGGLVVEIRPIREDDE